jgi:hypothetical protein
MHLNLQEIGTQLNEAFPDIYACMSIEVSTSPGLDGPTLRISVYAKGYGSVPVDDSVSAALAMLRKAPGEDIGTKPMTIETGA